jgi:hypothetical protein
VSTVFLIPDDPAFDTIGFDVTMTESREESSTITENPIEDGSTVADHVIHGPTSFMFEALITEKGIRPDFYGNADYVTAEVTVPEFGNFGVIVPSALKVPVLQWAEGSRILEMQERLTAARLAGVTFEILTMTRPYTSMLITSVNLPRGPLEAGLGRFQVTLRELVTVSTKTVAAPQPKEPRGQPKAAKGQQAPKGFFDNLFDESILLKGGQQFGIFQ